MGAERPRLLFVVTEDWYFVSHRLPLARAAVAMGYEVAVATRVGSHADSIRDAGIELIPLRTLRRSSLNPAREIATVFELIRAYRRWRPDIVHHVALKPVLLGSLAAALTHVPSRVNALTGLGSVFVQGRSWAQMLRPILRIGLRFVLSMGRAQLIVQNSDDLAVVLNELGASADLVTLIRGSGVDTKEFMPPSKEPTEHIVMLMSRMLWEKGVTEFVEAARRLRGSGVNARFVLVGAPDPSNPGSVPSERLSAWHEQGVIEWWGHRKDPESVLTQCAVFAFPSYYREGVPKVLLEAASCARGIVAVDVAGSREVVKHLSTGILVPARNSAALAIAIKRLLDDRSLRLSLGVEARRLAESEFSIERVIAMTVSIYEKLLDHRRI